MELATPVTTCFVATPLGAETINAECSIIFVSNTKMLDLAEQFVGRGMNVTTLVAQSSPVWARKPLNRRLGEVMAASNEMWTRVMFERAPYSITLYKWGLVAPSDHAARETWWALKRTARYLQTVVEAQ